MPRAQQRTGFFVAFRPRNRPFPSARSSRGNEALIDFGFRILTFETRYRGCYERELDDRNAGGLPLFAESANGPKQQHSD